jgi:hypothetical protein
MLYDLKSIDFTTTHTGLRIPNWLLDCIDELVKSTLPQNEQFKDRSKTINFYLEEAFRIQKSILIGWVTLNNKKPADQIVKIMEMVPGDEIVEELKNFDGFYNKFKRGHYSEEMAMILKTKFEDAISGYFINKR